MNFDADIRRALNDVFPPSVNEPERSKPPLFFKTTAALVGEFVGVQANRESIDKALDEVTQLKAELDNACLNLSSQRDGGSTVTEADIRMYEDRANKIEGSISVRMTAIDEAEAELKKNAAT